ncbi:AlpA family transcriptional regulator [Pseudomonas aeruginosa]|uniref:AlpA family transcriptional regulator n=1 Tax=Pseudomonas aeruginosa TaxID=287 RepID=UPI0028C1170C|nr:AlpA family transcriptional regulator [Pseudomonas aeruginosa]HDZ5447650.1 AlpA family transcriptional regulator [Pseudomonas aeruginosa]
MRIIRLKEVVSSTGLARSTIYKLMGSGEFPRPVPIVGRSVGWIESEIHEWIKGRIAQRDLMRSSTT